MLFYLVSILLATAGLTLLVIFSSLYGTAIQIVSFSIYGASVLLFYIIRTLYIRSHPEASWKKRLEKLDHVMIYTLTATTYTPVVLLLPQAGWAWSLFGVIWSWTLLASALRLFSSFSVGSITLFYYGVLLVLDLIAFNTVNSFLNSNAIFWFSMGGLFYLIETLLVVGHSKAKMAFPFVVLGSFCHFWAFFKYVL